MHKSQRKQNQQEFFFQNPSESVASLPHQRNTLTLNMFGWFFIQKQLQKLNNSLSPEPSYLLQQSCPPSCKMVWGQQKERMPSLQLSTGSLTHTKPEQHQPKYRAGALTPSSFHSGFLISLTLLRCAKWTVHCFCTLMQPGPLNNPY